MIEQRLVRIHSGLKADLLAAVTQQTHTGTYCSTHRRYADDHGDFCDLSSDRYGPCHLVTATTTWSEPVRAP